MTEAAMFTASWRVALAEPEVQPVRISIGTPRWITPERAEAFPSVRLLAPWGLLHLDDNAEFKTRYRARLERYAEPIAENLATLRAGAEKPLLLCCFENVLDGETCHRRYFADFWLERTGEAIPEWLEEPAQNDTLSPPKPGSFR